MSYANLMGFDFGFKMAFPAIMHQNGICKTFFKIGV